jgi:hypothetical protein
MVSELKVLSNKTIFKMNLKTIISQTIIFLFLNNIRLYSQSLIVGIPSVDVAEKHHLEVTHETQWKFWGEEKKWNSFNFACLGIGNNAEITATFNNLTNGISDNLAVGLGAKKVFELKKENNIWETKIALGGNVLYSTVRKDFGVWTYGLGSFRIPSTKTRFTGGLNYGQSQTFGFLTSENGMSAKPNNLVTFLGGIEQPITKHISIIGDWYSGTHDLASFIPAIQFDVKKHVIIIGYKLPNNKLSGNQALILECMFSIPTKKH